MGSAWTVWAENNWEPAWISPNCKVYQKESLSLLSKEDGFVREEADKALLLKISLSYVEKKLWDVMVAEGRDFKFNSVLLQGASGHIHCGIVRPNAA